MPVKIIVDTSDATAAEQQGFVTQHGATLQALGASASAHGYEFTYRAAVPAPPGPSQADVYQEMMHTVRYYGGVRYILLPIYLTAMATLAGVYFKGDYGIPHWLLAGAGIAASIAWAVFEWGLSENLRLIWNEIDKIVGGGKIFPSGIDPVPQRKRTANLVITRGVFYVLYGLGFAFWMCTLLDACRCVLLPG